MSQQVPLFMPCQSCFVGKHVKHVGKLRRTTDGVGALPVPLDNPFSALGGQTPDKQQSTIPCDACMSLDSLGASYHRTAKCRQQHAWQLDSLEKRNAHKELCPLNDICSSHQSPSHLCNCTCTAESMGKGPTAAGDKRSRPQTPRATGQAGPSPAPSSTAAGGSAQTAPPSPQPPPPKKGRSPPADAQPHAPADAEPLHGIDTGALLSKQVPSDTVLHDRTKHGLSSFGCSGATQEG